MLRDRCACKAVAYEIPHEFVAAYIYHCSNRRALPLGLFARGRIEREMLTAIKVRSRCLSTVIPRRPHSGALREVFPLLYWASRDDCFAFPSER